MAVNYTQDQVEYIVNQYRLEPTRETVENLAEELNKSVKSIIGKLSREGVYRKTEYTTKAGEKPVTKLELVEELEEKLSVTLVGLEKAPKVALKNILKGIANESM
jgi:N-methylhydantoinase B/oxoprolinase/acetone carboxylase alpha subunit